MPDIIFNDIYALFKNQTPAEAIHWLRLTMDEKSAQGPASQLAVLTAPSTTDGNDPVLEDMGLCIESRPVLSSGRMSSSQCLSAIAARLGLLSRILSVSWQHLSARKSFGVKTTKHQLIKAEFAEISNQIDFMLMQWKLRIAQDDFSGTQEDHWHISLLTNRAEKLMGGHGYLLGNTHSLSYLSMMIYSLYGKSSYNDRLSQDDNREQLA